MKKYIYKNSIIHFDYTNWVQPNGVSINTLMANVLKDMYNHILPFISGLLILKTNNSIWIILVLIPLVFKLQEINLKR